MEKRTIPALPARLIDPRPVIAVGSLAWLIALIVVLCMGDTGMRMWTCVAGIIVGLGIYGIFAWQRESVRRGRQGAQVSLPDIRRNGKDVGDEIVAE